MGKYHHLACTLLSANNHKQHSRAFPFQWCAMQTSDISAASQTAAGSACCNYQEGIIKNETLCLPAGALISCHLFSCCVLMKLILLPSLPAPASNRQYGMRPATTLQEVRRVYVTWNTSSSLITPVVWFCSSSNSLLLKSSSERYICDFYPKPYFHFLKALDKC